MQMDMVADKKTVYSDNPFVEIGGGQRLFLIAYVIIWQALTPALSLLIHGTLEPNADFRVGVSVVANIVLVSPLFFRSLGGLPIGWLHPLVFPLLFSIGTSLLKNPQQLFDPLLVWFHPVHAALSHQYLNGWTAEMVASAKVKADALAALAAAATYVGYMMWKPRIRRLSNEESPHLNLALGLTIVAMTLLFLGYMQTRGGILSHMASFAGGRHIALGDQGYILWVFRPMPFLLLLWYAYRPAITRSPLFWVLLLLCLSMQFASTGSRTAAVLPLLSFGLVWSLRTHKLPIGLALVVMMLAFAAIGVLGEVRRSTSSAGGLDFGVVSSFQFSEWLEKTTADIDQREDAALALPTIARVPEEIPHLDGKSYLGMLLFFVPRAVWPEKPRSVGAYAIADIAGRNYGLDGFYEGAGAPIGATAEAYWNFGVPGVLVVFICFGAFKRWLAGYLATNSKNPQAMVFYAATATTLFSPSSDELIPYFHTLIMLFFIFKITAPPKEAKF